jgi:hypothetical protein
MNTVQPISHLKRAFREDKLLKQPLHCQLLSPGELGHRRTIPLPESGGLSSGQRVMKLVRMGPGEDNLAGFENDCRPCLSGAHKLVCKRPVTRRKHVSSLEQSIPPYPSHPLTERETEGVVDAVLAMFVSKSARHVEPLLGAATDLDSSSVPGSQVTRTSSKGATK